jgi:integrase
MRENNFKFTKTKKNLWVCYTYHKGRLIKRYGKTREEAKERLEKADFAKDDNNIKFKDGKYYLDFTFQKKRIQRFGGYTKEQARNTLTKLKMQCLNKEIGLEKKKKPDVLFKDFAEEYIENHAKVNKRSWKRDQTSINNLKPYFRGMNLSEITSLHIEKYKAKRKTEKNRKEGKISETTINRELTCLKTIYSKANEWGRTDNNPAASIKNFEENNKTQKILTPEEIEKLIDAAPDHLKPIIIIAVNTGMRRGEVLSLKWKNIKFKEKYIEIEGAKSKSGKPRTIPMNSTVYETLRGLDKKHVYVFYNPKTKKNIIEIKRSFNTARKKAGLNKVRFHDLRHTAATRMCELGVPLKIVSKILGHSTIKMTERYADPTPETMKEAVEKLAEYIQPRENLDVLRIYKKERQDVNQTYII